MLIMMPIHQNQKDMLSKKAKMWTYSTFVGDTVLTATEIAQRTVLYIKSVCVCVCVCVHARAHTQSCPTLFDPLDCSPPYSRGSS